MITDSDIKKMKKVFVTKDDAKKFATKDDLEKMKIVFVTKSDFQDAIDQLIELISGGFNRMDKALEKLNTHDNILDNHEHRLDKLEDKTFC